MDCKNDTNPKDDTCLKTSQQTTTVAHTGFCGAEQCGMEQPVVQSFLWMGTIPSKSFLQVRN